MLIRFLFLAFTFLSFPALGYAAEKSPVREVIEEHIDVTGDGIADTLRLTVTAKDWHSPVSWNFEIKSGNTTIYQRMRNDASIDAMFKYVDSF